MTEQDLLNRLSIVYQEVVGSPGYNLVMLDGEDGDQIGTEDEPGVMLMGFSDEDLLENAELKEEDAHSLQQHQTAVKRWVEEQIFWTGTKWLHFQVKTP